MRKTILRRTASVALAGVMAMGMLAGCGNDASTTEAPTEKETQAQETSAETGDAQETEAGDEETQAPAETVSTAVEWEPFAENVTLQIPVYDRGEAGVPNVKDNYWTHWVQDNFGTPYNITVEYVPITRTDVMTSYSLLASSTTLPTMLMEYDYPKVAQWANDGYLTTFDMEEFASVAPTYYNRMVSLDQLPYTTMNGDTYFVLAERPDWNTGYAYQTFVRMDWLEEVGYDHVPATREEYVDAMTKIMEAGLCEHPGGGVKLTGVGSDQNYAYRTLPTDETEWAMYGDYNIPSLGWEPNYRLLKNMNEDYNAGILDPEYYITDDATAQANFASGKSYSYTHYIAADLPFLTSFYENNPDGKLAIQPTDVVYGETCAWRSDNPFGMAVGFSSQASEDEIKAAWMYLEWMSQEENLFTMQWGIEGENYTLNEEGLPVSVPDYEGDYKQGYSNNKDYTACVKEGRVVGDIQQRVEAQFPMNLPQSDELVAQIVDYYNKRLELAEEGYAITDCMFSVVLDAETDYSTVLTEKYIELRDNLTMCPVEDFDAMYEEAKQEYLDEGYQEVIDDRREAFEAGNSTKMSE